MFFKKSNYLLGGWSCFSHTLTLHKLRPVNLLVPLQEPLPVLRRRFFTSRVTDTDIYPRKPTSLFLACLVSSDRT